MAGGRVKILKFFGPCNQQPTEIFWLSLGNNGLNYQVNWQGQKLLAHVSLCRLLTLTSVNTLLCPHIDRLWEYSFWPVCLFAVCLFTENFYIARTFK